VGVCEREREIERRESLAVSFFSNIYLFIYLINLFIYSLFFKKEKCFYLIK